MSFLVAGESRGVRGRAPTRASAQARMRVRARTWSSRLTPLVALLLLVAVSELVIRLAKVPAYLVPTPSAVAGELAGNAGFFGRHALVTLG